MTNKKNKQYQGHICSLIEDSYKRQVIILSEEITFIEVKEKNKVYYQPQGSLEKYELINWKDKQKKLKDLELKNYAYIPDILAKYEESQMTEEDKKVERAIRKVTRKRKRWN